MMATEYPNLREYLDSDYARLPDGRIEALLGSHGMDAEAMEGFFDDLKKVASSVGQVALKAAPSVISVAAPLVGTAIGGPIGGAIGSRLGSLASGALASATGQPPPAGAPAAGSLVQNLLKPQTIQALGSMALGALGRDTVPVAGKEVPVSGFLNMLKTFLGNAEAEYNAIQAAADAALPEYLQDYAGLPAGDPQNDRYRAQQLEALLGSAGSDSDAVSEAESEGEAESAEFSEAAWETEQTEFELAELFEAEMDAADMDADSYESEEA